MEEDGLDLSGILRPTKVALQCGEVQYGLGCHLEVTDISTDAVTLRLTNSTFYPPELEQLETIIRAIREAMENPDADIEWGDVDHPGPGFFEALAAVNPEPSGFELPSEEMKMSDPCLSGLVSVDDDAFEWFDPAPDFHDEDDETPMVTLRLEMEHPFEEGLTVYAQLEISPQQVASVLMDDEAPVDLMDDLRDALQNCGGLNIWLNDPERAQMIWKAHEQPGGTA